MEVVEQRAGPRVSSALAHAHVQFNSPSDQIGSCFHAVNPYPPQLTMQIIEHIEHHEQTAHEDTHDAETVAHPPTDLKQVLDAEIK